MNYLMLDLETLGLSERPVIASIGAVVFNRNEIVAEQHFFVDWQDQQRQGLTIDADTVIWWLTQSLEAQQELLIKDRTCIQDALLGLAHLYMNHDCQGIWGNGALADIRWINNAYRATSLNIPWEFYQEFCYRTMKAMHPHIRIEFNGIKHNALHDARHQALTLIEILKNGYSE